MFCSPLSKKSSNAVALQEQQIPCKTSVSIMHAHGHRSYRKTNQIPKKATTICHSTAKLTEDLFAASHPFCSPGWALRRPLLKGCEPSCSFILLGHVWQDRSKDSNFYLLITCSLFSDPGGEKNLSFINVVLHGDFNQQS